MAYTNHGWHIPETESKPVPKIKPVNCGGPTECTNCALDVLNATRHNQLAWREEVVCYNDGTYLKAKQALGGCFLTRSEADDVLDALEKAGILLREKLPYV